MSGFRLGNRKLGLDVAIRLIVAASLLILLFYAFSHGQDTNWDQRNYHLAVPFLLLHGGFWESVQPAGLQSYFNPLPLIPAYLAITHLPPMLATAAIVAVQATAFVAAGLICLRLEPGKAGSGLAVLGFLLCLASPMALSEAGTTFVDLLVSAPILFAIWLLLNTQTRSLGHVVAAGLLLGLSAGMKLTAVLFLVGMPMFFLTGMQSRNRRLGLLIACGTAAIAGIAISGGWWHWHLWQTFGNPVFPLWNSIFHSPDYPIEDYHDDRYQGRTTWDLLRYPIAWLAGGGGTAEGSLGPASETDPRDPRFILIVAGLAALAVAAVFSPRLRARFNTSPASGLLLAWPVIYVVWLYTFGILRYMMPLEILGGATLLGLSRFLPRPAWRMPALLTALTLSVLMMHTGFFGRMHFADHWRTLADRPPSIPDHSVVFLADTPVAYVAASLPPGVRYINALGFGMTETNHDTTSWRQVDTLLRPDSRRVPFVLGFEGHDLSQIDILARLGLVVTQDCQHFVIATDRLQLCLLRRNG